MITHPPQTGLKSVDNLSFRDTSKPIPVVIWVCTERAKAASFALLRTYTPVNCLRPSLLYMHMGGLIGVYIHGFQIEAGHFEPQETTSDTNDHIALGLQLKKGSRRARSSRSE
jgi:hypothetical protein